MIRADAHVMLWDFHQETVNSPSSSLDGHLVWKLLTIIKNLANVLPIRRTSSAWISLLITNFSSRQFAHASCPTKDTKDL